MQSFNLMYFMVLALSCVEQQRQQIVLSSSMTFSFALTVFLDILSFQVIAFPEIYGTESNGTLYQIESAASKIFYMDSNCGSVSICECVKMKPTNGNLPKTTRKYFKWPSTLKHFLRSSYYSVNLFSLLLESNFLQFNNENKKLRQHFFSTFYAIFERIDCMNPLK